MTARHCRLANERSTARDLGRPDAPGRHRADPPHDWKLISVTPRYTIHECADCGQTRTSWAVPPQVP